jgi:hypothetical protein
MFSFLKRDPKPRKPSLDDKLNAVLNGVNSCLSRLRVINERIFQMPSQADLTSALSVVDTAIANVQKAVQDLESNSVPQATLDKIAGQAATLNSIAASATPATPAPIAPPSTPSTTPTTPSSTPATPPSPSAPSA